MSLLWPLQLVDERDVAWFPGLSLEKKMHRPPTCLLGHSCQGPVPVQLPRGHRALKELKVSQVERPHGEALRPYLEQCLASSHLLLLASRPPSHPYHFQTPSPKDCNLLREILSQNCHISAQQKWDKLFHFYVNFKPLKLLAICYAVLMTRIAVLLVKKGRKGSFPQTHWCGKKLPFSLGTLDK